KNICTIFLGGGLSKIHLKANDLLIFTNLLATSTGLTSRISNLNLITVPESIPVTLSLGIRSLVLRFDRGVFAARLAAVLSSASCWDGERLGDFAAADDVFTTVLVLCDIVSDPACCSVSQLLSALNCFKYSTRPLNLDVPLETMLHSANFSSTLKPTRLTFDVLLPVLIFVSFTVSLSFSSISDCCVDVTGTKHCPDRSLVLVFVGVRNCSSKCSVSRDNISMLSS
uniref:Uncharacterized protein n=1 Tax=Glossina palpalis gambiensis TaxID=67801 RepID=A0A1B0BCV4_9MUSC